MRASVSNPFKPGICSSKNQVKDLSPELFERFNTAVDSRDVKPFALQEQQVRLQQINFVVGPKDAWSSLHE